MVSHLPDMPPAAALTGRPPKIHRLWRKRTRPLARVSPGSTHPEGLTVTSLGSSPTGKQSLLKQVPPPRRGGSHRAALMQPVDAPRTRVHAFVRQVRAWMVVLPLDALLLMVPVIWAPDQVRATLSMTALSLLLLTSGERYRARLHLSVLDELPGLIGKILTAAAVVACVIALRHEQEAVTTFLVNVAIALALVVAGRTATGVLIRWSRRRRLSTHPTILIGGGELAAELAHALANDPGYGLQVVGFVDDEIDCPASMVVPRLGSTSELDGIRLVTGADVLLIADGTFSERDILDRVRTPVCKPCDLLVVPRLHLFAIQAGQTDQIGWIPIQRIRTPNLNGVTWLVKRGFDIVVAASLLLFLAPVIGLCALAVRIEGGPGVIFRQVRVGRGGELFECLKLRSMRPLDENDSATTWSVAEDDRVGPVGRFLRRSSLDELPQLWNILRGDMTLVGPRPERPHFVEQFSAQFDRYAHRHRVVAGLTGFAQVSGLRGDTSIADRARYDNYYIENWTLWLDVKIIVRTFAEVLFARGR
jgi:exopolysaccharide biosynthesis polyprenyl glycosylphosphotransferase